MKIGDAVAKVTKTFGIEPCDECKERQKKLNDLGASLASLFGGPKKGESKEETHQEGSAT